MRFFDFVEQQHAIRLFGHGLGQLPALIKANIARGRPNQSRDRMALHVFGHVKAQQINAHAIGQLFGNFGFADAGGAGEEEAADRLAGCPQSRTRHLDGLGQGVDGKFLAEDDRFQVAVEVFQCAAVIRGDLGRRHAGDFCNDFLDIDFADDLLLFRLGQNALRGACLVDHVDGFVRQVAVGDEAYG